MPNRNEYNGAIKGRSPLTRQAMPSFSTNELQDAAVWIENGKYVPKKSMPSLTGPITDGELKGLNLSSGVERIAGLVATGDVWEASSPYVVSDSTIELENYGCSDFSCRGAGATAFGGSELVLKNVDITTRGSGRCATICTQSSTLRVYDSRLKSYGGELPADYEPIIGAGMMEPPWPLGLSGTARTHLSMDGSRSFFTNCDIYAAAWGAFSTDASGGCLYLEANDCRVTVEGNGYGTYADNGCHNCFKNTSFKTGNMVAIQDGNSSLTFIDCTAEAAGCGLMLHGGLEEWVDTGLIEIVGGSFTSEKDLLYCKSTNVDIYVRGAKLHSNSGAVLRSICNDDPIYYERAFKGPSCYGVQATFEDLELVGDILHEDTDRKMRVTLENVSFLGRVTGYPELHFEGKTSWKATADSFVTLCGEIDASSLDAQAGVTIHARLAEDCSLSAMADLPSGGRLVIEE